MTSLSFRQSKLSAQDAHMSCWGHVFANADCYHGMWNYTMQLFHIPAWQSSCITVLLWNIDTTLTVVHTVCASNLYTEQPYQSTLGHKRPYKFRCKIRIQKCIDLCGIFNKKPTLLFSCSHVVRHLHKRLAFLAGNPSLSYSFINESSRRPFIGGCSLIEWHLVTTCCS